MWVKPDLHSIDFQKERYSVHLYLLHHGGSWRPNIDFSLLHYHKQSTSPEIFRVEYHEIYHVYQDFC